ncbi:hypothetical protein [Calothrix rhizosoleniae]|uniref:hypothetical protein n=1 Tax=Calothrix rhizosoleniae TaxID=888997 RepID=UPI00135632C1|nr:hypothetical protein [Calothrix rhizosoleniae]
MGAFAHQKPLPRYKKRSGSESTIYLLLTRNRVKASLDFDAEHATTLSLLLSPSP